MPCFIVALRVYDSESEHFTILEHLLWDLPMTNIGKGDHQVCVAGHDEGHDHVDDHVDDHVTPACWSWPWSSAGQV